MSRSKTQISHFATILCTPQNTGAAAKGVVEYTDKPGGVSGRREATGVVAIPYPSSSPGLATYSCSLAMHSYVPLCKKEKPLRRKSEV